MLVTACDTSSYTSRLLMPCTIGTRVPYSMMSTYLSRHLNFDVQVSIECMRWCLLFTVWNEASEGIVTDHLST